MNPLYAGLAVLALLVALVFGVNKWESRVQESGKAACVGEVSAAAVIDDQVQRKIEVQRFSEQRRIDDEAKVEQQQALSQHAVLADTVRGLRQQLTAERAKRSASNDPAIIRERKAADTYGDLFGNCAERYNSVAAEAQGARTAGLACERSYESIRSSTPTKDKLEALRKEKP